MDSRASSPNRLAWLAAIAVLGAATIAPSIGGADGVEPLRVLFIGNSYTRYNDLPRMVEQLAASVPGGPRVRTEREAHGGYTLRGHWRVRRVRGLVRSGRWNAVVLQPHSLAPLSSEGRAETLEYARRFREQAAAAGARVVLFETWARRADSSEYDRLDVEGPQAMQERLDAIYRRFGEELDAPVAPIGRAWRRALEQDPTLALHRDDGTHPAVTGTYLSACVVYGTLTGRDPRDATWRHWRIHRRRAAQIRAIAAESLVAEAGPVSLGPVGERGPPPVTRTAPD